MAGCDSISSKGSSHHSSAETNLTTIHEDVGSIPVGQALSVAGRGGGGLRPLTWEHPYATGTALKKQKKKKKKNQFKGPKSKSLGFPTKDLPVDSHFSPPPRVPA